MVRFLSKDLNKALALKNNVWVIYGPNTGLVDHISSNIIKYIYNHNNFAKNDWNYIGVNEIENKAAELGEYISAIPASGKFMVIKLSVIGDDLSMEWVNAIIKFVDSQNHIVIVANDLALSSNVRKILEKSERVTAVGCYLATITPAQFNEITKPYGIAFKNDIASYIVNMLGEIDLFEAQNVIKCLCEYFQGATTITTKQIDQLMENTYCKTDIFTAILAGDASLIHSYLKEFPTYVYAIRVISRYIHNVILVHEYIAHGYDIDSAIDKISPQIFFKEKPVFKRNALALPKEKMLYLLERLNNLEYLAKNSGWRDEFLEYCLLDNYMFARAGK